MGTTQGSGAPASASPAGNADFTRQHGRLRLRWVRARSHAVPTPGACVSLPSASRWPGPAVPLPVFHVAACTDAPVCFRTRCVPLPVVSAPPARLSPAV